MENPLYLTDSYLTSCKAKVLEVKEKEGNSQTSKDGTAQASKEGNDQGGIGKFIFLDQTVFYPRGGGQPCDTGKLVSSKGEFLVIFVTKQEGKIAHETSGECTLQVGDEVECIIDWSRRYKLMRMHTAGHILAAIMYSRKGILITGNQLDVDKSRFDFSMENFDKAAFQSLIDEANQQISRNLSVEVSSLPREEAMKVPGAVKLAVALPPEIKTLRMVKIGDVDYQADGGTHVKNTSEIGKLVFLGADNKGKNNRRIYYTLE